ncbi:hypothetical protein FJQ54_15715 [Sandaracinobacter neustonicus]|uniref:Uncharacterized protein n=1 Tax=Sandaracinobacter neustonicus TaxID=1715348 RepID=A0A501XDC3_9SPHN|nr:hypothetical protein [Sandaracinobacter neustonicus]TPE58512.1 hypothetical protein FJQ54_15715 [Sandaracinobacter neustonicus]
MAIVSTAVESNGWVLAVTGDWPQTGGAWEFNGADRPNGRFLLSGVDQFPLDPKGSPKVVLQVRTAGYDRIGGQAVANAARAMQIVATKVMRLPYPDAKLLNETDNGNGTRTVRLALSKRVPAGASIVQASFGAGWKQGEAATVLTAVANQSVRQVIPVISRWATPSYLPVMGTDDSPNHIGRVDLIVAAEHPEHFGPARNQAVAAVKLTATDGTITKEYWFSEPQTSPAHGDNLRCWGGEIDLSGLNPGLITVHRTMYPWIGEARVSGTGHVASVSGGVGPAHETPLHMIYDPTGSRHGNRRRYVFVDSDSPRVAQADVASVVLHTDIDSARSAPVASKAGNLMVALQAFKNLLVASPTLAPPDANGVSSATRACDYWEIILTDGQAHTVGGAISSAAPHLNPCEGLTIVRGDPAAANPRATTILRASTAYVVQNQRWWFRDLRLELGGAMLFSGSPTSGVGVTERVTLTGRAGFETSTTGIYGSSGSFQNQIVDSDSFAHGNQPSGVLIRNMQRTRIAGGTTLIGVTINREAGTQRTTSAFYLAKDTPDQMIWNCRVYEWPGSLMTVLLGAGLFGNPATMLRLALVNVQLEGQAGDPAHQLGEYSYIQMQDCIWEGCTLLGSRYNWHNEAPMPFVSSGTTVTAGVLNHGLAVGEAVSIAGLLPEAYNGTFTVASVPDVNRFTYVAASEPGAMATYKGGTVKRVAGGPVIPLVRMSLEHNGNCLRNVVFDRNATKQDQWIADGTQTGCWELLYGVGQSSVFRANRGVNSPFDWQYAFDGMGSEADTDYAVQTNPAAYKDYYGLVNDATNSGSGTWGGDYRPSVAKASRLIGKATLAGIDRDIDGQVRGASFAAGAYEADEVVVPEVTLAVVSAVHGHAAGVGVLKWTAGLGPAAAAHAQLVTSPLLLAVPPAAETGGGQRTLVVGFEDRGIAVSGE